MGQNFNQAKRDDTFWPMPNILNGSVCPFVISKYFSKLSICSRLHIKKIIPWNSKKMKIIKSIQKGIDSIV